MRSVIIPLPKSKSADLDDINNYRAIAISTAFSKLFECVIADDVCSYSEYDNHQFGFKAGHSTGLCSNVLKHTVDYYTCRGSYVFASFIDLTQAFDRVNYWNCFSNCLMMAVIAVWLQYWHFGTLTNRFVFVGETRYRAAFILQMVHVKVAYITHPVQLVYPWSLSRDHSAGCNIGGLFVNVLAYADDIVLFVLSLSALQHLLSALQQHVSNIDMMCWLNG